MAVREKQIIYKGKPIKFLKENLSRLLHGNFKNKKGME
jgi:hypothetical protein